MCLFWGKYLHKHSELFVCECVVSLYMCMLGNSTYVFACSNNVQHIKSWQSFHIHKLIHTYSSAPKDWISFQELPNMTHFSTQSSLSRKLWMQFLDSWEQTGDLVVSHSRYICDFKSLLRFKYSLLPCFCWITRRNVLRICPEFPSQLSFLLLPLLLWLMAGSVCVRERGGECSLGTWPESHCSKRILPRVF